MTESLDLGLVTLGAALLAAISPILNLIVSAWLRRREKAQDYKRQDAVAARLLARQDAVAAQAAEAARLLLAAQAKTSQQNIETQGKLNHISTLVNSNLTKEMEGRLQALYGQASLIKEKIALLNKTENGANQATRESLESLELIIANLEMLLKDRGQT